MENVLAKAPSLPPEVRPWLRSLVRVGYAAKGVIYLLIGVLALQLAVGEGGRVTDASGVLREIVEQPFGNALLIVAIGILAYAGWEIAQAYRRHPAQRPEAPRAGSIAGSAIIKAVRSTARWVGSDAHGIRQQSELAGCRRLRRTTMSFHLAGAFCGLVGLGIATYGSAAGSPGVEGQVR